MFKFLGIKIPPYHFLLTLGVLTLDSLRSLSRGHTDPFSLPYDPSLPRQQAAREEARTFNRLSISDPMFFLHEKWGAAMPAKAPAHWVEKDITEHNVWPWGSVHAGYFVS